MSAAATLIAVLVGVITVVMMATTLSERGRAFWARYFSRSVGLAVTVGMEPAVIARIVRAVRASCLGAAVGEAAVLAGLLVLPSAGFPGDAWLSLGGYLCGAGVGAAFAALTASRPLGADERRFARAGAVALRDYVAPVERIGARVVVAAAAVLLALSPALPLRGIPGAPSTLRLAFDTAMVIFAILSLLLFEVGSRRILERGQPAGSSAELAWDDALRAVALRSLASAPLCLGLWTAILIGGDLLDAAGAAPLRSAAWWMGEVLTLVLLAGLIAFAVAAFVARPQRYYLRRLWPAVADGARATTGASR